MADEVEALACETDPYVQQLRAWLVARSDVRDKIPKRSR
jgi:hypothetical protein